MLPWRTPPLPHPLRRTLGTIHHGKQRGSSIPASGVRSERGRGSVSRHRFGHWQLTPRVLLGAQGHGKAASNGKVNNNKRGHDRG
jgi:hypothetical protein